MIKKLFHQGGLSRTRLATDVKDTTPRRQPVCKLGGLWTGFFKIEYPFECIPEGLFNILIAIV